MILFKANGRCAAAVSDEKITSGSVGIEVTFQLSEVYDDLAALAVFRGSGAEVSVILPEPVCTVPPEVLAEPGGNLLIGVYARDGEGTIAVPTVWANVGPILGGATPDLPDTPPTPDWTGQVELALAEAVEKSEEALEKASAVEEEGARQVQAVQDAGTEALDAIETGKTAATEAVEAAQAAAVQVVQTESSTQQADVQAKGEEVLASIPADYTTLNDDVSDLKRSLIAESAVDSSDLTALSLSINPSGNWTTLSGATAGYITIPSNAEKIVITPRSGVTNAWAFLNSIGTPTTGEKPDFSASYPARISDNTSTPHEYAVAPGMNYIYFLQTNTSGADVFPASVSIHTVQLIDDTLSVPGKAADAKKVGDLLYPAVNTDSDDAHDIPSGTDYDTLLTCGNYVCRTGAIAQTMTHCPTSSAHRLFVFKMHADERIIQSIVCSAASCKEYRRYYSGTNFSDWIVASGAEPSEDIIRSVSSYANYQMDVSGLLPLVWYRGSIGTRGVAQSSSTGLITYFIPIAQGTSLKYKKLDTVNVITIAEYGANKEYLKRATLRASNTEYTVGDNCYFIRFYYDAPSSDPYPEFAYLNFVAYLSGSVEKLLPIGLHTMPKNQGVLNCIKRARQMTDIKWTPASDIDRVNIVSGQKYDETHYYYQNIFAANREYTGLPYSSRNFIGVRKGITQFVTSAANENSSECTDSQYAGNVNTASYYGTVCVALVSYALHAPQINSPSYTNLVGLTKVYDLLDNGVYHDIDDLELCDVLWEHGHVAIVTDIVHDQLGHVVAVEVSESTKFGSNLIANGNDDYGGKCRRKIWPKDEFLKWFSAFGVYRYDNALLSKIPYEPNKFVPMIDEPPYVAQAGLPCMPVDGDHAYYYLSTPSQRNVRVLIRDAGYSHLRVKQNGEDFVLLPVEGLTEVTVTCDSSKEAVYEAYLCNEQETMTSASCTWLSLASTESPTMAANEDGSYTFSIVRQTNAAYPFVIVFNGTSVNGGQYSPITNYAMVKVSGGYKFTFTVTPPTSVSEISTFSLLFDAGEFGWFPTSTIRP